MPLGSTEQHGPHLPLDTDTRIAVALWPSGWPRAGGPDGRRCWSPRRWPTAPAASTRASPARSRSGRRRSSGGGRAGPVGRRRLPPRRARQRARRQRRGAGPGRGHAASTRAGRSVAWSPRLADGDSHAGRTETSVLLALAPEAGAPRPGRGRGATDAAARAASARPARRRPGRGDAQRRARRPDRRARPRRARACWRRGPTTWPPSSPADAPGGRRRRPRRRPHRRRPSPTRRREPRVDSGRRAAQIDATWSTVAVTQVMSDERRPAGGARHRGSPGHRRRHRLGASPSRAGGSR